MAITVETAVKPPHAGVTFGPLLAVSDLSKRTTKASLLDPEIEKWVRDIPPGKGRKIQLEKPNATTVVGRFYKLRKSGKISEDYTMSSTGNGRKDEVLIKHYLPDSD